MQAKIDGEILERVPITYLLHKSVDGWKIAAMVLHGPDGDQNE